MQQRSILIAIDLPVDVAHLDPALDLARSLGWTIDLLHVSLPNVAPDPMQEQLLSDVVDRLLREGLDVSGHTISGPTVGMILRAADEWKSEFIVIVGHKHQVTHRTVLGSVASTLLKTSRRPVLVLPPQRQPLQDEVFRAGLGAATDRLIEVLDRTDTDRVLIDLRDAAEAQQEQPTSSDRRATLGSRMQESLELFEVEHPSVTRAINDVAYYLSGIGI